MQFQISCSDFQKTSKLPREIANAVESEPSSSTVCESTTEDSVSKKIEKANKLINKVKETLNEIKSKRKLKYAHSVSSNSETDSTTADHEDLPLDRPQTRRKEDDDVEMADKFKMINEKNMEGYNLLQAKLNTITESSETDESAGKKAVNKNLEDKILQTEIDVTTTSTQCENHIQEPLVVKETQTETELLYTCTSNHSKCNAFYSKTQQYPEVSASNLLQKSGHLNVQILPSIDTTTKLSIQKPFVFYINTNGDTIVLQEDLGDNTGLFLYERSERRPSPTPTVIRVKTTIENKSTDLLSPQEDPDVPMVDEKIRGVSFVDVDAFPISYSEKTENEEIEDDQNKEPLSPNRKLPSRQSSPRSIENVMKNSLKSLVLRSFQTKSDFTKHDPDSVDLAALEWAKKCDPAFYQTFINPDGIQNLTNKVSSPTLNGQNKEVQVNLNQKFVTQATSDDFDKYSFSISYSDEITPEESCSIDQPSVDQDSNASTTTIEDRKFRPSSVGSRKSIKSLKIIKDKIEKEHPEFFEDDIIERMSKINQTEQSKHTKCSPVLKTFISGLVEQQPELIAKVLPRLHEAIKKPEQSINDNNDSTSEDVSREDLLKKNKEESLKRSGSSSKKEDGSSKEYLPKKNRDFSVNFLTPLYNHMGDMISPLRIGKDGRYADEKDLFFEVTPEKSRKREMKTHRVKKYRNNHNMTDSSMASSITSLSEGEVKCKCGNSIGEVHPCRNTFSDTFQKNYRNGRIQKKKSYFSSWVTYYINKDMFSLNDSTSSSNK